MHWKFWCRSKAEEQCCIYIRLSLPLHTQQRTILWMHWHHPIHTFYVHLCAICAPGPNLRRLLTTFSMHMYWSEHNSPLIPSLTLLPTRWDSYNQPHFPGWSDLGMAQVTEVKFWHFRPLKGGPRVLLAFSLHPSTHWSPVGFPLLSSSSSTLALVHVPFSHIYLNATQEVSNILLIRALGQHVIPFCYFERCKHTCQSPLHLFLNFF